MQSLRDYIHENYSSKTEFAKANGVHLSQVSLWLRLGYVVNDHVMLKELRKLPHPN